MISLKTESEPASCKTLNNLGNNPEYFEIEASRISLNVKKIIDSLYIIIII